MANERIVTVTITETVTHTMVLTEDAFADTLLFVGVPLAEAVGYSDTRLLISHVANTQPEQLERFIREHRSARTERAKDWCVELHDGSGPARGKLLFRVSTNA